MRKGVKNIVCLAVPLKITKIEGKSAVGEAGGLSQNVRVDFIPDLSVGDYVMVHAGFAIEKMSEKEALEGLEFLAEVLDNTSSAGKKHVTSANDKMAPRASKSPKLATADSVDENANANPAVAKMPADTMSEGKVPPKARNTACRGGSSLRWRR